MKLKYDENKMIMINFNLNKIKDYQKIYIIVKEYIYEVKKKS